MAIEVEIRRIRLRLGWTQAYLVKLVGVRQATISRIDSNAKNSS
ncbi:helix-turn-helix domain-containing protein [Spiroplasma ixodetis]